MVFIEQTPVVSLLLPGPMILVFGATIAIGFAGSTITDGVRGFAAIPKALKGKKPNFPATIDSIVELADKARCNGLLALDGEGDRIGDPFFKTALQGLTDGKDSEDLPDLLEEEIQTRTHAEKNASKYFTTMGGYAPTVGIIGPVVSLAHVLENLSSPDKLGPMIASAFIATLWGLVSANFIWLPLGTRLYRLAELESERMHLIVEAGKSAPRVVAKGADFVATRIREEARSAGVPMVQDLPLARALHRDVPLGQPIPNEHFGQVAHVLAFVMMLRKRGASLDSVLHLPPPRTPSS
ncbi:hypothetical protein ATY41_09870 [Leifsonia xyli subsp. xyli]|uniref:Chemotaxis motility protein A n=2 Tax=Leifsonia xyli subsp. xyli TaxID=59736 RepID=Q6AGA0_LEIXX|nr:MotA/TolQ/ExbB proton channel family protein [Leifsonia xyli]AAT88595.1 chemotaxis motility protein A [Leifsonia xyli subsp. xyli str. CTCB07]ODA90539.1 hypothetical protein ATY41_09870 [Leifsonia xyli subsp. xyli]